MENDALIICCIFYAGMLNIINCFIEISYFKIILSSCNSYIPMDENKNLVCQVGVKMETTELNPVQLYGQWKLTFYAIILLLQPMK